MDGPSFNSGLLIGDIIEKIDNQNLDTMNDLKRYIYTKNPGDEVSLLISRSGKELTINITLGKK